MQDINVQLIQSKIATICNLAPLDSGGQKIVFSGVHKKHGNVVVKVVKLVSGSQLKRRVEREIEVAITYNIPNTARLYEWGALEYGGGSTVYIVEEFVQGVTLRRKLQETNRLPPAMVLNLIGTLLESTEVMECKGIVHRDIKPENIMVCPDGTFKLLDFGIARVLAQSSITPTEAHFGPHTVGYAAPEQFRNLKKEIDSRADLFAIGVVAYESLSGRHPFAEGARDQLEILRRTQLVPPPLHLDNDGPDNRLTSFISVLMHTYPSRRPPSAALAKRWFESIRSTMNLGGG